MSGAPSETDLRLRRVSPSFSKSTCHWGETFFGIKNAIDQKFDENLAKKLRKQLKPENENLWKLEIIKDKLKTIPNSDEEIKATIKDKLNQGRLDSNG